MYRTTNDANFSAIIKNCVVSQMVAPFIFSLRFLASGRGEQHSNVLNPSGSAWGLSPWERELGVKSTAAAMLARSKGGKRERVEKARPLISVA